MDLGYEIGCKNIHYCSNPVNKLLILQVVTTIFTMIAVFYRNPELTGTEAYRKLERRLTDAGVELCSVYISEPAEEIGERIGDARPELIVSLGGDGTFLSAARLAAPLGVPVLGANMGRLGFLSENRPEDVAEAIVTGDYRIEDSPILSAEVHSPAENTRRFLALNEISVHRLGPAMLGVNAVISGSVLPTYWADGLIVATGLGSTAYSLSAGGPIAFPDSRVLLVTPIAPHNLNVRPLIIPDTSSIELSFRSRDPKLILSADNVNFVMAGDSRVDVSVAQFSLKRARLRNTGFVDALTTKLYWGEDMRNRH